MSECLSEWGSEGMWMREQWWVCTRMSMGEREGVWKWGDVWVADDEWMRVWVADDEWVRVWVDIDEWVRVWVDNYEWGRVWVADDEWRGLWVAEYESVSVAVREMESLREWRSDWESPSGRVYVSYILLMYLYRHYCKESHFISNTIPAIHIR